MTGRIARVLVIAGSDSGGGAGLQGDIKTITMLGGYAATAVTALTAQNSLGVHQIQDLAPEFVDVQARAVLGDIGADAIKTGMLGSRALVETVAHLLDDWTEIPVVVDPVMIAKGGRALLDGDGQDALRALLVPRAALLTPNAPEAAVLTGLAVETTDDLRRAGDALLRLGAKAVLLKGGHIPGDPVVDVLMTREGETVFKGPRQETPHTHGTGCAMASACALGLAERLPLDRAVARAWAYVAEAIRAAPGLGAGHGPLDHGWPLRRP